MVDLSLDSQGNSFSEDLNDDLNKDDFTPETKRNKNVNNILDSDSDDDEPIMNFKSRKVKKLRHSRSMIESDSDNDTESKIKQKGKKDENKLVIDKKEKKISKIEGDSDVSGVSSDTSSSDEESNEALFEKILKKKRISPINPPTNVNKPNASDSYDSAEDELGEERIPKKVTETDVKDVSPKTQKKVKRKPKKARKTLKKIVDSDDNDSSNENDPVEDKKGNDSKVESKYDSDSNDSILEKLNKEDKENISENEGIIDKKLKNLSDSEEDDRLSKEDRQELEKERMYLDEGNIKPLKKRQAAKESEKVMKEIRSEQQRLQREKRCEIPYHEPTVKSVKEFLKRVPTLPNRRNKNQESGTVVEPSDNQLSEPKKTSLFSTIPVLKSQAEGDLEFVFEDIPTVQTKPAKRVNSFMNKVAKQIKTPVSEKKIELSAEQKGLSNTQLKCDLREKIREKRHKQYEEIEEKRKKLEDQIALEEDESFDEANSDSSSENDESENEEVEKWNAEENRIRLEETMAADEEESKDENKELDLNAEEEKKYTECEKELEEGTEDTEDAIDFKTVSTQLLKSDLLNSNSGFEKKDSFLTLPCENTQDLYKDDSRISSQENSDEYDAELGPNFHLSLDEDTQFTQHILDSQGFLKNKKQSSKEAAKIFEEKPDEPTNNSFSMTQMLGLCSGNFSEFNSFTKSPKKLSNQSILDFNEDNANDSFSFGLNEGSASQDLSPDIDRKSETQIGKLLKNSSVDEKTDAMGDDIEEEEKPDEKEGKAFEVVSEENERESEDVKKTGEKYLEEGDKGVEEDEEDFEEGDKGVDEGDNAEEGDPALEDENVEEEEGEENEELKEWNLHLQQGKKKWKKKAFYEDEAELSGSDVGSDDEDLGSEYDEYEVDSDIEDLPDDEKLKRQLHKIHQKKMNDQDKREMRLLQELYLEDGELAGGERRKRNFRWRNIDGNFDNDNTQNEDVDDGDNYSELKERNQELVERNKYLLELEETQSKEIELDENSQMVLEKINRPGVKQLSSSQPVSVVDVSQKITPLRRSGSFMRNQSPLTNLPKSVNNKNTKSFVFQAMDEPKKVKKTPDDKYAPPRKRQRNEFTPTATTPKLTPSSIFTLL